MKQKAIIMETLEKFGPMTSHEIDSVTGLGVAKISAYCGELVLDGLVRREENFTRYPTFRGWKGPRMSHRWHPLFCDLQANA